MIIERTGNEVIIRLPASIDTKSLQLLINYLNLQESTSKSQTRQEESNKSNTKNENELFYEMSNSSFVNAWAEDEPEYSLSDIKTPNPDYEGR